MDPARRVVGATPTRPEGAPPVPSPGGAPRPVPVPVCGGMGNDSPGRLRRRASQGRFAPTAKAPLRAASHAGLPPALIVGAGIDPLYGEGVACARKLRAAGVAAEHLAFPRMTHAFFRAPGILDAAGGNG